MTLAGGAAPRRGAAMALLMCLALVGVTGLAGLSACASVPKPGAALRGEVFVGRMTVRVAGSDSAARQTVSAAFELSGTADDGRLDLSTPLGTTLARARWQPGNVALVTPQGETRYADLASLTREMLGEALPVEAFFDWLRGRPWPGAQSRPSAVAAEPGFNQLGWDVNLARFADAWVSARREQAPIVTVQVKLDRP